VGLLASSPARADTTVDFSVSGIFSGGGGTETNGGTTVTFSGLGNVSITYKAPTPATQSVSVGSSGTSVSLGSFSATASTFYTGTTNESFTLTINQTQPSGSPGGFTAQLDGSVFLNNGTVSLQFQNPTQFTTGGISYQLTGLSGSNNELDIDVSSGKGKANLSANVSADPASPTPEPSTLALAGVGGLTLLGYGWRRRNARPEADDRG
jgi:hypothetical protein